MNVKAMNRQLSRVETTDLLSFSFHESLYHIGRSEFKALLSVLKTGTITINLEIDKDTDRNYIVISYEGGRSRFLTIQKMPNDTVYPLVLDDDFVPPVKPKTGWKKRLVNIYNIKDRKNQSVIGWEKDGFVIHHPMSDPQGKQWVLTQVLTSAIIIANDNNLTWYKKLAELFLVHSNIALLESIDDMSYKDREDYATVLDMMEK